MTFRHMLIRTAHRTNMALLSLVISLLVSGFSVQVWSNLHEVEQSMTFHVEQVITGDFNQPTSFDVDDLGNLYIMDGLNHEVDVLNEYGRFIRSVSLGHNDIELYKSGKLPMALVVHKNHIYVADTGNHRITVFDLYGVLQRHIFINWPIDTANADTPRKSIPPHTSQPLSEPVALHITDNVLSFSDRAHHRVCQQWLDSGELISCVGSKGSKAQQFKYPFKLERDNKGVLHVVDVLNGRIQKVNRRGTAMVSFGRFGTQSGELYRPNGVVFDDKGRLYVSDGYFSIISIFENNDYVGSIDLAAYKNSKGKSAVTRSITDLKWVNDRLYVLDTKNSEVLVLDGTDDLRGQINIEAISKTKNGSNISQLSKKECVSCHLTWDDRIDPDIHLQDEVLPVASEQMCYSCHHGAVIDSRSSFTGSQHFNAHKVLSDGTAKKGNKNKLADREDSLPKHFPALNETDISCGTCHTPHNQQYERSESSIKGHQRNTWMRENHQGRDTCQQCHESKTMGTDTKSSKQKGRNHPLNIRFKKDDRETSISTKIASLQYGLPKILKETAAHFSQDEQMVCESCHQVHGGFDKALLVKPNGDDELCVSCHEAQHSTGIEDARNKGVHPSGIELDEPIELNGKIIKTLQCQSCHAVHDGVEGTASLVQSAKDGSLCANCHEQANFLVNTDHDLVKSAKDSRNALEQAPYEAGLCGSCHSMHRAGKGSRKLSVIAQPKPQSVSNIADNRDHVILKADQLCINCHDDKGIAERRLVKRFNHPAQDLILQSDPTHMPLLDENENIAPFGKIACVTCHDPHKWQPKQSKPLGSYGDLHDFNNEGSSQNSFLRSDKIQESFCVSCHGVETLIKYRLYHDQEVVADGVDYIR